MHFMNGHSLLPEMEVDLVAGCVSVVITTYPPDDRYMATVYTTSQLCVLSISGCREVRVLRQSRGVPTHLPTAPPRGDRRHLHVQHS